MVLQPGQRCKHKTFSGLRALSGLVSSRSHVGIRFHWEVFSSSLLQMCVSLCPDTKDFLSIVRLVDI
uniref:Uncharacterized protein n=1 Tax=Mus spicilegus TaxID=10103 RepID=A0A8C6GFZ2_MUSSI